MPEVVEPSDHGHEDAQRDEHPRGARVAPRHEHLQLYLVTSRGPILIQARPFFFGQVPILIQFGPFYL